MFREFEFRVWDLSRSTIENRSKKKYSTAETAKSAHLPSNKDFAVDTPSHTKQLAKWYKQKEGESRRIGA